MSEIEGWKWVEFAETGSTNDEAALLTKGANGNRYVVTAKTQMSGRGRRGRPWVGLEGNLFMSQAVETELNDLSGIIFVVSLSLLEAVRTISPQADIKLKWPNDVLINGHKISGILLEKGEGDYLIIGIGVNIVAAPQIERIVYPAASLKEMGINTDRLTVLREYLKCFNANWQLWKQLGFEEIKQRWLADVKGLGCEITVHTEKNDKSGIFAGIDDNGALLLKTEDKVEKIYAGDVFYL